MVDFVSTVAQAALACLSSSVAVISQPPLHVRLALPGDQPYDISTNTDICCEGLAYIALGDTYPSSDSFPDADIVRQAESICPPTTWAQEFVAGIVRCAPVFDGTNMPSDADYTAAALLSLEDAAALREFTCCLRDWFGSQTDAMLGMSLVIGRQTQDTPQGGCMERQVQFTAQVPACECG